MASTDAPIGIGTEFIGYRIEALLGQGGMGVVYRAFDLRLKRSVALKFVAPEFAEDESFRERFLHESELAASLEHPNVVPIHDAGEVGGRLYLAMRYVDGADLRSLLHAEGALEPSRAVAICRQVAAALDAAHARGLVHRDVKPSNVLLDGAEHVYLTDFGLTRRLGEGAAAAGHSIGTPAYLAPEQLDGGAIDGRADVYALGCLLFECLTGAAPFAGSRMEVAWAHLESEPPSASERNPHLPAAVDSVLRRTLAKRAEDRPSACVEVLDDAGHALGVGGGRTSRRLRLVAPAAVLVIAAVTAVVAAAVRSGGDTPRAAPPPRLDSLVRIDPWKNVVTDVIPVGGEPVASAVSGSSAWVYNWYDGTVSRIDSRARKLVATTAVRGEPLDMRLVAGPMMDADHAGVWVVTVDAAGRGYLTRITASGRKRVFRVPGHPKAVAVGRGAIWVLARTGPASTVLRIDPATGRVVRSVPLGARSRADSLNFGFGAAWVVSSGTAILYRVDGASGRVRQVDLGTRAGRPDFMPVPISLLPRTKGIRGLRTVVGVGVSDFHGSTAIVDRTAHHVTSFPCCPLDVGGATLDGTSWSFDPSTGVAIHWGRASTSVVAQVRVANAPYYRGFCMTSMATGAGAVWVTLGANNADSAASTAPNRTTAANCPGHL